MASEDVHKKHDRWPFRERGGLDGRLPERSHQVARPVLASVGLTFALFLAGCDEESVNTCYPDGTPQTTEYTCVSDKYCRNQDMAERLGPMSLGDCMVQCKSRGCSVIQYDCGTDCWLLDNCGGEVDSGCRSSTYYRDVNWVPATTTTTTATTAQAAQDTNNCFPDGLPTSGNSYQCTPLRYCQNQDQATRLGSMTLLACIDECNARSGCDVIQYDCNTDCWLLIDTVCGNEEPTGCGSSVYYKQSWTITTTPEAGGCGNSNPSYSCTPRKYCTNQALATRAGDGDIDYCYSLCDASPSCTAIQHDCGTSCWLMETVGCGLELDTQCGSSIYHKVSTAMTTTTTAGTTATTATTTTTTTTTTAVYILATAGESTCPGSTTAIPDASACEAAAIALGYTWTGPEDTTTWPNGCYLWVYPFNQQTEVYFNTNTGNGNLDAALICKEFSVPDTTTSTTESTGGFTGISTATTTALEGNCLITSAEYVCTPFKYCSLQQSALKLGSMSLESCKVECRNYENCGAIQYDCNTDCWLLTECGSFVDTTCGSSVYIRDLTFLWRTTTTTTVLGQCFPDTTSHAMADLVSSLGLTCTSGSYCADQDTADKYGPMSLDRCLALCRAQGCTYMQYDCNTDCWLFTSENACSQKLQTKCGSSVYQQVVNGGYGTTGNFYLGDYSGVYGGLDYHVAYSNTCNTDDCLVTVNCPAGPGGQMRVVKCQTIPPDVGDGVTPTEFSCTAKGAADTVIMAEAICVDRNAFGIVIAESAFGEGLITAACPSDSYPISCNCLTAWTVQTACDGKASFAPTLNNGVAECRLYSTPGAVSHRRRGVGDVQAKVSAVCSTGSSAYAPGYNWVEHELVYSGPGLTDKTFEEVQYCGWAGNPIASEVTDCNAWMANPSVDGGCFYSECPTLADCVRICNNCGYCQSLLVELSPDAVSNNIKCYFRGNPDLSSGSAFAYSASPSAAAQTTLMVNRRGLETPWALYINNRDPRCSARNMISGVSFFHDASCTQKAVPTTLRATVGVDSPITFSFTDWKQQSQTLDVGNCDNALACNVEFTAQFSSSTVVLCAVVHGSSAFAQSYDADGLGESRSWTLKSKHTSEVVAVAKNDATGTLVQVPRHWNDTINDVVEDETISITSELFVQCYRTVSPLCIDSQAMPPMQQRIREAFASMLALPQHAIEVGGTYDFTARRLADDENSGRQLQNLMSWSFSLTFTIVADSPGAASVYGSVRSTLEDMRGNVPLLEQTLANVYGLPFNIQFNSLILSTTRTPPVVRSQLVDAATTTTTTTVTDPPPATVEAAQDDTAAIIGAVFGSLGGLCALRIGFVFVRRKCRKAKTKTTPAYSGGPSAIIIGGKAVVRSDSKELEGLNPLNEMATKSLPKYWTGFRESKDDEKATVRKDLSFDELMYVKHEEMEFFQEMVNHTYRKITTQDRLCPTKKHDKTKGGCPCVQPGGDPGLPTGYQVKRVIRVEDSDMFTRYIIRRHKIQEARSSSCEAPDPPIFTRDAMDACSGLRDVLCDVDDNLNEVYLWHGTQVRTGLKIAQEDFKLTFAGSGAGTMYGKGLYFSESCTKADEYAADEPGGHYDGVRALLLCRVCIGKFHYTLDREPSAIDKYHSGECDSTIGDRAKSVHTYREIVVYNEDQVYPEYLVLYERLQKGEKPELPPKDVPFLLELPLYWKNVGLNPYTEGFREHWIVKPKIRELIQRLANGSAKGGAPKVVRAKRVEDSNLWCRYIDWKRQLGQQLQDRGEVRCTPPNELDGNPESGHALTATILEEFHGDEAISVENMAVGLNETLLWHGTSKQAAEAIAEEGFEVKTSGTHGRRFGHGVYLAEDLNKSLGYCKASGSVKYVLLCRAVCGHFYYTEKHWHSDATKEAANLKKHCVLANPDRQGPREYIVMEEAHVYPEYIVEFED